MIVVDSSVWINHFRDIVSPQVEKLRAEEFVIVGDIVALEVLRGVPRDRDATPIQQKFATYGITPMLNPRLAVSGAASYRRLRSLGVTIAKIPDLIIATFCIAHGHDLLHQDRDFTHFERHLGLKVVH
jgi:predicted nucleic acid-binding protein